MEERLWEGNGRDREVEKKRGKEGNNEQEKDRQDHWAHTQKDKRQRQWDSAELNRGKSYSAGKVENSIVFTVKAVIKK